MNSLTMPRLFSLYTEKAKIDALYCVFCFSGDAITNDPKLNLWTYKKVIKKKNPGVWTCKHDNYSSEII